MKDGRMDGWTEGRTDKCNTDGHTQSDNLKVTLIDEQDDRNTLLTNRDRRTDGWTEEGQHPAGHKTGRK